MLVGATGSGKSTFAARHFCRPRSSRPIDAVRSLPTTRPTRVQRFFDLVHAIAAKRLARRRLTVIDAAMSAARNGRLARRYHALPVAIVFDLPAMSVLLAIGSGGSAFRAGRATCRRLRKSLRGLDREGFRGVHCCAPRKMSRQQRSCVSRCGATDIQIADRSTSSATSMAAARSLRLCSIGMSGGTSATSRAGLRNSRPITSRSAVLAYRSSRSARRPQENASTASPRE